MNSLRQDVRYAFHTLRRSAAFTAGAIATLTIAIAANTTMLSVVQEVLVRALPYANADHLFVMGEGDAKGAYRGPSFQTFLDWQRQSRTLSGIAFIRGNSARLETPTGPERIIYGGVTPGFFGILGVHPIMGREFDRDEENGTAGDVAVISYELWQSSFGGDRGVVGRTINYDSAVVRIIGVLPAGVSFFPGMNIWRPLTGRLAADPALGNRNFHVDSRVLGRLKPDVPLEAAKAEFRVIQARLATEYPGESGGWVEGGFFSVREIEIGDVTSTLLLLGAGVFVVLLIACVNVSNLSLVRAIAREREMAVRRALGASTARLARALFTESALLGVTAGGAGLLFSTWAIRALRARSVADLPRATELTVDLRVFAIALALSLLVTLLISAASMLRLRARGFADPLRGGRQHGASARAVQLKNILSVAQLGLAVTLLLCGALLVRSIQRIQRVDLGYDPDHVVAFLLFPPAPTYDRAEDAAALYQRVLDAVGVLPGVTSVALVNRAPPGPFVPTRIVVPGRGADTQSKDVASYRTVSAGYLLTLHLSVLHGRWFTEADMKAPGDGIVVSESVAKRYWPGRDPVGEPLTIFGASQRRADYGMPQPSHVIGVVADLRSFGETGVEPTADVYVPFTRLTWPAVNLLVRVSGDPTAFIPALKRALLSVDPAIPVTGSVAAGGPAPMGRGLSQALSTRRYVMWLLGGFAASAFLLALVGVYGVIAYGVTQRTHEFGVRMALGAAPAHVFAMVLKQGLSLALLGVGLGVGGGLALTRLLTKLLYDTSATELGTFVVVSVAVGGTVLLASAIPARRAAMLEPVVALRE
jgi:putative ABC transport system permease protein